MKYQAKTALGVDLSQAQACAALVRRERRRIVLVKAARVAMPAGLIQDGRITDPAALAKVLGELKGRCRGRAEMVGVSLSGSWVRVQILELPNPLPANLIAFVQGELRQLMPLASDQIVSDHCSLASTGAHRLLAAVADKARALPLVEACERLWPRMETVEPALIPAIRGLHAKKIAGRLDRSVLLALIRAANLELCVFQGGHLDFIRTRDLSEVSSDPEALIHRLAQEILAVVQYYGVEVAETPGRWEILVLGDDVTVDPDRLRGALGLTPAVAEVDVLASDHWGPALSAECEDPALLAETSPVAVGLAARLLGRDEETPSVNLIPSQIVKKRVAVRQGLLAAVCGAAVLLVMGLSAMGLKWKSTGLAGTLGNQKKAHGLAETVALMTEHRQLQTQIDQITQQRSQLEEAIKAQRQVDWPGLLGDLQSLRPLSLRVARLSTTDSEGKPEMVIDGWSLNYGAINQFVKKLDQSEHIVSATVVKSGQEDVNGRSYFVYQVKCALRFKVGI